MNGTISLPKSVTGKVWDCQCPNQGRPAPYPDEFSRPNRIMEVSRPKGFSHSQPLLSSNRSCHPTAPVFQPLLSSDRSCHPTAPVIQPLLSSDRSCHPERSEGSLAGPHGDPSLRSELALERSEGMTPLATACCKKPTRERQSRRPYPTRSRSASRIGYGRPLRSP
jgi:hypothetical protein